jgi:hypothetical protein
LQLQVRQLTWRKFERKVPGESRKIAPDLLVQARGGDSIKSRQVGIEHHALLPQEEDLLGYFWPGRRPGISQKPSVALPRRKCSRRITGKCPDLSPLPQTALPMLAPTCQFSPARRYHHDTHLTEGKQA